MSTLYQTEFARKMLHHGHAGFLFNFLRCPEQTKPLTILDSLWPRYSKSKFKTQTHSGESTRDTKAERKAGFSTTACVPLPVAAEYFSKYRCWWIPPKQMCRLGSCGVFKANGKKDFVWWFAMIPCWWCSRSHHKLFYCVRCNAIKFLTLSFPGFTSHYTIMCTFHVLKFTVLDIHWCDSVLYVK